jgi:hypothetical protein
MTILHTHSSKHDRRPEGRPTYPAPDRLPAFPHAVRIKPKGGRIRWRNRDGSVFEWESRDGALEMFGVHGWHLGEYDHVHGEILKLAEPGRRTEP